MALRDYQNDDLAKIRDAMRQGARRLLFEASVGYGKSLLIETLARAYSDAGRVVLVLSNRSAVIGQLTKRAAGLSGVQVMTVQAADRRREELAANQAALILVDEAHMGGAAAQYTRVLDCAPGARVVGFTGTPKPDLFGVFPCHVQGKGARWLTDQGFLAPLRYHAPNRLDLSNIAIKRGEYDEAAVVELLEKRRIYGHAIESYRTYGIGVPTLGFCVNVQHATDTAEQFRAAGHQCEVLIGADSNKEVERKIASLVDGGLVFSVDKVSAGFDLPDLRVLLSLRPTKSEQLWIQQLGRVARASDGKPYGLVLDHVGNTLKLGTLTMERDWNNPTEKQADRITADGDALAIRQCDACMAVFEAGPSCCPFCDKSLAKDTRMPKAESVRLELLSKAEEAAIENRRKNAVKRMGGGYKLKKGFQVHRLGKSWGEAHHIAIDQLRRRLDDALRNGDEEVAAAARAELEAYS